MNLRKPVAALEVQLENFDSNFDAAVRKIEYNMVEINAVDEFVSGNDAEERWICDSSWLMDKSSEEGEASQNDLEERQHTLVNFPEIMDSRGSQNHQAMMETENGKKLEASGTLNGSASEDHYYSAERTVKGCHQVVSLLEHLMPFLKQKFVLLFLFICTQGTLATFSNDTIYTVGDTVHLQCDSERNKPIDWSRSNLGGREDLYFGTNGKNGLAEDISPRIMVDVNASVGRYDLIIKNATVNDTGIYECTYSSGHRLIQYNVIIRLPDPKTSKNTLSPGDDSGLTYESSRDKPYINPKTSKNTLSPGDDSGLTYESSRDKPYIRARELCITGQIRTLYILVAILFAIIIGAAAFLLWRRFCSNKKKGKKMNYWIITLPN